MSLNYTKNNNNKKNKLGSRNINLRKKKMD